MAEVAFLRAVLDRPDDDGPRLVFADWLEERGDPRGAFIRAQVELERLGEYDPRRPALELLADQLLVEHGDAWKAPLAALLGHSFIDCTFRRGFIEDLTLGAPDLLRLGGRLWSVAP